MNFSTKVEIGFFSSFYRKIDVPNWEGCAVHCRNGWRVPPFVVDRVDKDYNKHDTADAENHPYQPVNSKK